MRPTGEVMGRRAGSPICTPTFNTTHLEQTGESFAERPNDIGIM